MSRYPGEDSTVDEEMLDEQLQATPGNYGDDKLPTDSTALYQIADIHLT